MIRKTRNTRRLDDGWLFHLGDIPAPLTNRHLAAYMANKAGYARGAGRGNFDDSDWRSVRVPHDWSIEGSLSPENHVNAGFLPRGIGWYRRHFALDPALEGRRHQIRFDGIATHCDVYVNGHLLHHNHCGYTSFSVDFTDIAQFGDSLNCVAVRVDATYVEGWWYEGAGIYRHAWLTDSAKTCIANEGVFVHPEKLPDESWNTKIETTFDNRTGAKAKCSILWAIFDPSGVEIAVANASGTADAFGSATVHGSIPVTHPKLWSVDSPALYTLRTQLAIDNQIVDETTTRFGYRSIRFDPNQGFFLNGQSLKLNGVCNHQDHGGLGVALPDSIQRFRIRRLKEMGCNALRTAHHPPTPELLDVCDELGMLVMDENRNFGSSPRHLDELTSMVKRDRNHPSVILWSICNEEAIQGTPAAREIAVTMVAEVKKHDPTRPVTAAISGGILNDNSMSDVIDILSINYQLPSYDDFRKKRPHLSLVAGETHCALTTRSCYETDSAKHRFASYDEDHAPWGATARATRRALRDRAYVAGTFIWTGFDYRGEPSPHEWPSVTSHWGLMDLCGFPKDTFHLHKAWYTQRPFIHLLPHWNWREKQGNPVRVQAYTNADEVELFLNGQSLGRMPVDPIEMAEWRVPFAPGVLEAVAWRDGAEVARTRVATTGTPATLGLEIDPTFDARIDADGACAIPITLFAIDAEGQRVPDANVRVELSIEGPARLLGVGNGDPTGQDAPTGNAIPLFNGLAQAIVQTGTTPGEFVLRARADGLRTAELRLRSLPCDPVQQVPPARRRYLISDWQMTRVTPERPSLAAQADNTDMNTFERVQPNPDGQAAWKQASGYALYRAKLSLPKIMQINGGKLVFHGIVGEVEVFIDQDRAAIVPDPSGAPTVAISPAREPRTLNVILSAQQGNAGIVGPVELIS